MNTGTLSKGSKSLALFEYLSSRNSATGLEIALATRDIAVSTTCSQLRHILEREGRGTVKHEHERQTANGRSVHRYTLILYEADAYDVMGDEIERHPLTRGGSVERA